MEVSETHAPYARRLARFDPGTGAGSYTELPSSVRADGLGWDHSGRLWIAWCGFGDQGAVTSLHLARPTGAGTITDEASAGFPNAGSCFPQLHVDGQEQLFVDFNETSLYVPQGGVLNQSAPRVLYDSGGLLVATDGAHVDGGPAFANRPTDWGDGYLVYGYGTAVLAERAPGMLMQALPRISHTRMMVTPAGLFAVAEGVLARFQGPPEWPVSDPVPNDSQAMTDEANRFRAAAGLQPLRANSLIAQAAANHSRYWTLNNPTGVGLGLHKETPGLPGFTGVNPQDRCAAVGTACGGEVMYSGVEPVEAVQGWMATAFHRSLLMYPSTYAVGGAKFGSGPVVMNAGGDSRYLGLPYGYPVGVYDGPLGFRGELPDPAETLCPGQISAPYGTAITVSTPTLTDMDDEGPQGDFPQVAQWDVQGPNGPVKGCSHGGIFQPDDALLPGSDYRVTVYWSDAAQPAMTWTFHTTGATPTSPPAASKRSTVKVRAVHSKSRLWVKVKPNLGSKQWLLKVEKRVKKRWKKVRSSRTQGKLHTRTLDLPKGTYRVRSQPMHGYEGGKSKPVRLTS